MLIDIHTHITYSGFPDFSAKLGRRPFTADILLRRMDLEGIDKSVVLPLENPENNGSYAVAGTMETLEACRRHPGRLIPFCNIDPRMMLNTPKADLSALMGIYKDYGCLGIGEVCAQLPVTSPLYHNLFRRAGEMGMPLLFHLTGKRGGTYGMIDKPGMPGLEAALAKFPQTVFIGHAMAFWGEISADLDPKQREAYPKGPVKKGGRLCELLAKHPNLYADISAGSGHNAVSRDPGFGYKFLEAHRKKVFFGTDRFTSEDEPVPPVIGFLNDGVKGGKLSRGAYDDITHKNFQRVFNFKA